VEVVIVFYSSSSVDFILSESATIADSRKGSMFREAASQRIETSTDLRSVTSKDDLGFAPPSGFAKPSMVEHVQRDFEFILFRINIRFARAHPHTQFMLE
jgi:hypothetical protein